jgi:glutathione S-transferase
VDKTSHRNACISILKNLDKEIKNTGYFFSNNPHKIDLCILPFIRQFRIANPYWFDNHEEIPRIQKWLSSFLESYLLKEVMVSYEVWEKNKPVTIFPISQ